MATHRIRGVGGLPTRSWVVIVHLQCQGSLYWLSIRVSRKERSIVCYQTVSLKAIIHVNTNNCKNVFACQFTWENYKGLLSLGIVGSVAWRCTCYSVMYTPERVRFR